MADYNTKKFSLDEPPPGKPLRKATLEGLVTPSSSGEVDPEDDSQPGDAFASPVAQAMQYMAGAEDNLKKLGAALPKVLAVCQDAITVLRQAVPEALADLNSGMSMGMPAGAPQSPMGPPPAGLPMPQGAGVAPLGLGAGGPLPGVTG